MATPLRVLVVDDDPGMRDGMALSLKRAGFFAEQARSGEEALRMVRPGAYDAVVTDLRMPGIDGLQLTARLKAVDPSLPVLLITAFGSLESAREAMRLGAFDFLSKPFSPEELTTALNKALKSEGHLKAEEPAEAPVILTVDPVLGETLVLARRAADSRATILIQAESGTGKELLAKLIHSSSPRRNGAFVAINCAAIPENLLESELFGYEKGAFTGATGMKQGRFEQADGGTLVLDEVGELPLALQGKLLRALQERTVDRLGGSRPIPVDVRLIALTNRDLQSEVKAGRFREDLYYRLNVIPLDLPPLRERPSDLPLLASHFTERYARENDRPVPTLTPSFLAALSRHPWAGNIRELENVIQRCVVLNQGRRLSYQDLRWLLPAELLEDLPEDPPETVFLEPWSPPQVSVHSRRDPAEAPAGAVTADVRKPLSGLPLGTPVTLPLGLSLPELERFWLLSTLAALKGNRTHCAEQLDIALRTVRNKINEYKADGFTIPASQRGHEDERYLKLAGQGLESNRFLTSFNIPGIQNSCACQLDLAEILLKGMRMKFRLSVALHRTLRLATIPLLLALGTTALLAEGPNDPAPFINPTGTANGKKVLFDNTHANTAGAADWVINGGFSHLANALAAKGYFVQELRKLPPINYNDLSGYDVLVTAESNYPLKTSEQAALLQFVQNGGSILFIADHYNADRNKNRWDGSEVFNGYRRGAWTNPAKGMSTGEAASYLMQGVTSSDWLATNFGVRFRYNALDNAIPSDIVAPSQCFNITAGVSTFALHAGCTLAILDPTKAKGIVYVPTTVTKWASAVDQGVYNGGGRAEGPYVAISKVGLGKAAFIGDSSPVENTGTKYLKEETGGSKTTYAGWEEANDAVLIPQLVDWLANHESYTALNQVPGLQLDTPTPVLAMEDPASSTEPQAEPWATPSAGYLWYDFSTYKTGSYGAGTLMPKNLITATMSAPTADLTVNSGASVAFAGTATDSSTAATLTFKWTFGDGTSATGTSANHAYTNAGSTQTVYTATFTATDNSGYVGVATRVIRVNPGAPQAYTITASTGANGVITPSGTTTVNGGANQIYTITPNSGYAISSVLVDGISQGAITSYTFSNVAANHTISASFAATITKYVITASAGANGSISPAGSVSVNAGASQTFTLTPNAGYTVSSVTVDGVNKGAITSYTFSNVSAAHTISAAFAAAVAHTLSENFDTGTKTAYTTGTVTFASGTWTLNDALLGSSSQDPHTGVQSVRVRNSGKVTMGFNFAYGAQTVSVKHAVFGTDAASTWGLWYSTNSGSTWTQAGSTITTSSSSLSTATFTLNKTGTIRFEIRKTDGSTRRLNFDDFKVVGY